MLGLEIASAAFFVALFVNAVTTIPGLPALRYLVPTEIGVMELEEISAETTALSVVVFPVPAAPARQNDLPSVAHLTAKACSSFKTISSCLICSILCSSCVSLI